MDEFYDVLKDPGAYGRTLKEKGRRVVGYLCSYAPEEMIYAAGAHPLRLFGTGENVHLADAHFQSYCCSLVRGVLEGALAGHLDFLDGMVFPHTCDSIQRLSDVWRMNVTGPFHLDLVLPVKLDTESARVYLIDVLKKFKRDLEAQLQVTITDDNLKKAFSIFNRLRDHLKRLDDLQNRHPGLISGSDAYTVVKASMVMDRDRFLEIIPAMMDELEEKAKGMTASARKRLVLAGGICHHPDLYRIIEEAGGAVVGDDLCTGSRYVDGRLDEQVDPMIALAERYLTRAPCPAKHSGLFTRAEHILRIAREKKADGVVFFFLKFCDPHAFDYPDIKKALDREGIPSLLIEAEDRLPSEGQLKTRFETFIEMV